MQNGSEYIPTPNDIEQVIQMSKVGITIKQMCEVLEISDDLFNKHFSKIARKARTEADRTVATTLYANAVENNNLGAQIWWTKARMGWSEKRDLEISGRIDLFVDAARQETQEQWLERIAKTRAIDHNSKEVEQDQVLVTHEKSNSSE